MRSSRAAGLAAAVLLSGLSMQAHAQQAERGVVGRMSGLTMSGNQPIQIESDRLEVLDTENRAIFTGNVNVTQGDTLMKAGKMTVFYVGKGGQGTAVTGSANIERLEVQDKVYIKSKDQVATGDRGTFEMATEILTLAGREVVLSQGTNVLVGCQLVVHMKTGRAEVEGCKGGGGNGRVIMSITPGAQTP